MTKLTPLTGSHLRTHEAIFRHPVAHNVAWRDVHALLRHLGHVAEEPNGNLRVTRNGQTLVLRPPRTKDIADTGELMELRHFLERSENPPPAADSEGKETGWLVVIDHHEARIFSSVAPGSVAQQILPHEPGDFFRHAHNSKDFARGRDKPDPNSFFEPVAQSLKAAANILVFGRGKGTGSEMEQFVAWVQRHHPELAKRIVGSAVVDEHHLTDAQILAHAREFFAKAAAARTA